jgi:hypothetical protein
MTYAIILSLMVLINIPVQLYGWWLIFGIWPKSWMWFIFFSILSYLQAELVKWLTKRMMEDIQ